MSASPPELDRAVLSGGGEMGRLIRAHAWEETPLGGPSEWPPELRTLVAVLLGSSQPMFIAWGSARTLLYNDGYAAILARKHPEALGRPMQEVWQEIWDQISPIVEACYGGEPVHRDDIRLVMNRRGYPEETHFSFSYTPVRDGTGRVQGIFCPCMETTESVKAREAAVAEHGRLRDLLAQAPGFMCVLRGPDHVFELVNEAYRTLVGHDRDAIGLPVREVLPEVEGQGFFELLDRVYASGEPFVGHSLSVMLHRKPGAPPERRHVDLLYQPITNPRGEVTGIFVEGVDVSERVQAEALLRESEERRRLAAEAARIGVWDFDPTSGELRWDEETRALFGLSGSGAVTYETFLAGLHPDDRAGTDAAVRSAFEAGGGGEFEREYRTVGLEDGRVRWVAAKGRAFFEDGVAVRFIGTVRDITARKRTEAEMAETAERYRLAARATSDAIWDWHLETGHVLWNEVLASRYGYPDLETSADWWKERIHPEDRVRVLDGLAATIDGGGTRWEGEYRFLKADGHHAYVLDRGYVLRDALHRPLRMIGAMLDLSERRQAEERQTLIQRELHHRVKNTLATVQAIAGSTLRSAASMEEFRTAFADRLISLGKTHTLITENAWEGARLRDLLLLELDPYDDGSGARISLAGPDVALPADMAVALGMALHELTTNAAKHGSLSALGGCVCVEWTTREEPQGTRLHLSWRERHGPPVSLPSRRGFGSQLLLRALGLQLKGRVEIAYAPGGVEVDITAHLPPVDTTPQDRHAALTHGRAGL